MIRTVAAIGAGIFFTVVHANEPPYKSLEEFCLATKADTAENCACGQETADRILTDEEQRLALGLMTQDPDAQSKIMSDPSMGEILMNKLAEVTKGCAA